MITLIILILGLLFYWKPIYLFTKWAYHRWWLNEDAISTEIYWAVLKTWFQQAWSLMKP